MIGFFLRSMLGRSQLQRALRTHFKGIAVTDIVTAARDFPITSRVDVHSALEELLAKRGSAKLLGIHSPMNQETPTMAHLLLIEHDLAAAFRIALEPIPQFGEIGHHRPRHRVAPPLVGDRHQRDMALRPLDANFHRGHPQNHRALSTTLRNSLPSTKRRQLSLSTS